MGLAESVRPNAWRVRRDFGGILQAVQRTSDHQKMLAAHGVLMSDELATLRSVPKSTLYNWANQGRPPYVKLGRSLRFDIFQIEEFRRQGTMGVAGKR